MSPEMRTPAAIRRRKAEGGRRNPNAKRPLGRFSFPASPSAFPAWLLALSLIVTSSVAAPPAGALTRFSYTEYHMGVDARLVVYAPDQPAAEDAGAAAFARIAALDSIMSDY